MTSTDAVRLTVFQLEADASTAPSFAALAVASESVVRQVDTVTARLLAAADAVVREFVPDDRKAQLTGALLNAFTSPPVSGYAAVVNRPTGLAFVAVWPWADRPGQLGPTLA